MIRKTPSFDYNSYQSERERRAAELGLTTDLTSAELRAMQEAPVIGQERSNRLQTLLENKQALYEQGLDEDTISRFQKMALDSDDPEAMEGDMLSAIAFSRNLGISVTDAYNNLDSLMDAQFFNPQQRGKTAWKAINDSFALGELTTQRGELGYKLMSLAPDSDEYQSLMAELQNLNAEIEARQDYLPRNWATTILKSGANTVAYSAKSAFEGIKGSIIGKGIASGVALAGGIGSSTLVEAAVPFAGTAVLPMSGVIAAAGAAVGIGMSFYQGAKIEGGNQYLNLLEEGIDHNTASRISTFHGIISSSIEQGLGAALGGVNTSLMRALGVDIDTISSRVITKGILDGTLSNRLMQFGITYAPGVVEEGLEEVFQGFSEDLTKNLAFVLDDMNAPVSLKEMLVNALDNGIGGMAGAVLLNIPSAAGDVRMTKEQAIYLRSLAARVDSKETFKEKSSEVLDSAGIEGKAKQKVQDAIWAEADKSRNTQWNRVSDALIDSSAITETPTFDSEGNQITASWDDKNEVFQLDEASYGKSSDEQSHTIRFGNLNERGYAQDIAEIHAKQERGEQLFGNEHDIAQQKRQMQMVQGASISFTTKGDSLTIDSVSIADGMDESVREKAVRQLISIFPDYDITWNAKTAEDISVRDSIISQNTRGSQYGLNLRERGTDSASVQYVKRWLGNNFSQDGTENSVMAMTVEAMAKRYGLSGQQFIEKYAEDIQSIRGNKQAEALIAANGEKVEDVKGFISAIKDAHDNVRAVIYAGEHADLSTFQHEMHHLVMAIGENKQDFRNSLESIQDTAQFKRFLAKNLDIIGSVRGQNGKIDEAKFSRIMEDLKQDEWTAEANEFETELFNAWQREGKSLNKEMNGIFQRIAEGIRKVFSILRRDGSGVELNKEISDYYDRLFGYDPEGKDKGKDFSSWKYSPDKNVTPIDASKLKKQGYVEQADAVRKHYEGTDAYLKTPDGKATSLSPDMWIDVRTPAFKELFGDWENDPASSKVILDESGEPAAYDYFGNGQRFYMMADNPMVEAVSDFSGDWNPMTNQDLKDYLIAQGLMKDGEDISLSEALKRGNKSGIRYKKDNGSIGYILANPADAVPADRSEFIGALFQLKPSDNDSLSYDEHGYLKASAVKNYLESKFGISSGNASFAEIENRQEGKIYRLSKTGINKMLSNAATQKSKRNGFSINEHNEAVANIDTLFENALLIESSPDKYGSRHIKAIERFETDFTYEDDPKVYTAYFTAKVHTDNRVANSLYSIELTAIKNAPDKIGVERSTIVKLSHIRGFNRQEYTSLSSYNNTSDSDSVKVSILTQMIGQYGVRNLKENSAINLEDLSTAESMEKDGRSNRDIWQATGWYRGLDGIWRIETPDIIRGFDSKSLEEFESRYEYGHPYALSAFVSEDLLKAYPEAIGSSTVTFRHKEDIPEGLGGYTEHKSINSNSADIILSPEYFFNDPSALLHEVQHIIQKEEGFDAGGNPQDISERISRNLDYLPKALTEKEQAIEKSSQTLSAIEKLQEWEKLKKNPAKYIESSYAWLRYGDDILPSGKEERNSAIDRVLSEAEPYYAELEESLKSLLEKNYDSWLDAEMLSGTSWDSLSSSDIRALKKDLTRKIKSDENIASYMSESLAQYRGLEGQNPSDIYKSLTGEVEARNVQQRYYNETLRNTFPLDSIRSLGEEYARRQYRPLDLSSVDVASAIDDAAGILTQTVTDNESGDDIILISQKNAESSNGIAPSEWDYAVIPSDASEDSYSYLSSNGIQAVPYDRTSPSDRESKFNTAVEAERILRAISAAELSAERRNVQNPQLTAVLNNDNNMNGNNGNSNQSSVLFQTSVPESFKEELDALSEKDIGKPNETIVFSETTPIVFKELGMPDLPVEMYKDKMARALYLSKNNRHGHSDGLSKEIIQQIAEKFADPIMVFLSKNDKDLVAVYEVYDKNGNAVMASLKANAGTDRWNIINLITSIYGRKKNQYENWIDEQRLKYVDDTKKEALTVRLQLPSALTSNQNVLRKSEIVNKYKDSKVLFQSISDDVRNELYELAYEAKDYKDFVGIVTAMVDGDFEESDLQSIFIDERGSLDSGSSEYDLDFDIPADEMEPPDEDIDFMGAEDTSSLYPTNPLGNYTDEEVEELQNSVATAFQVIKGTVDVPEKYTLKNPDTTRVTVKDKNESFDHIIGTDEGILEYLNGLRLGAEDTWNGTNIEDIYDSQSEEGAEIIAGKEQFRDDLQDKAAPLIRAYVYKMYGGRNAALGEYSSRYREHKQLTASDISSKTMKSIRGIIRNNIDFYRNLYANATAETYWKGMPTLEEMFSLESSIVNDKSLSISEIRKLSESIQDEKLRDSIIRGGKADLKEIRSYLVRAKEREESFKKETELANEIADSKLESVNGELRKVTAEGVKAQQDLIRAENELNSIKDQLEKKANSLARTAKDRGLSAEEVQDQQELAKKLAYAERLRNQKKQILNNLYKEGKYYGDAGRKKAAEIDAKLASVIDSITELQKRKIITAEEAIERLVDLSEMIGEDKVEKAVSDAVAKERLKAANAKARMKQAQEQRLNKAVADAVSKTTDRFRKREDILKKEYKNLKDAYRNRIAARKLRDAMMKMADRIMRPASHTMDISEADKLRALQSSLDPNFRSGIRVNGQLMDIRELKRIYRNNPSVLALSSLSEEQLQRVSKKSLDEMSLSELNKLYEESNRLREIGRAKRQAYLTEQRQRIGTIRSAMIDQITSRADYKPPEIGGSVERKKMLRPKLREIQFATLTMPTKAQLLDGNKKGIFYDFLVRRKRECQTEERRNIYRRSDPIVKMMEERNIDNAYWYTNTREVALPGLQGTRTYTYSDLAYIYLSRNNQRNVEAVSYGTLVTKEEKAVLINSAEKRIIGGGRDALKLRNEMIDGEIRKLGDARYKILLDTAIETIEGNPDLLAVVSAIEADLNDKDNYRRICDSVEERTNQHVEREEYYLPISRNDYKGETPSDKVQNDLLNQYDGKGRPAVDKGFTKSRITISPRHQPSVNIDLFGVWQNSVYNQEHLIAFGDYVADLNAVFENKGHDRDFLLDAISSSEKLGKSVVDDIKAYIAAVANPDLATASAEDGRISSLFRIAKGGIYSGYLGFKLSAVVMQAITSPAAFMGKVNPLRLGNAMFQLISDSKRTYEKVYERSPFMRSRSFDLIKDEIKRAASDSMNGKFSRKYQEILNFGMEGLEWIDKYCVTAGWKAIYDQEIIRLGGETDANIQEAVRIADEYVSETQPLTDPTEIAPYLLKGGEAMKFFTQFRASLNVIWNNAYVNRINIWNRQNMREACGMTVGYIGAGILVALIRGELTGDDDDEDKNKVLTVIRNIIFASTSQFVEAVPLLGDSVSSIASSFIKGEYEEPYDSSTFPAASKLTEAFGRVSEYINTPAQERNDKMLNKAVKSVAEGTGLALGLPVSSYKDVKRVFDNKDEEGWGKALLALFGRRSF